MFERIQKTLVIPPEDKYAGTYVGKTKLATIHEGQELQGLFLAVKANRFIKGVQLLAQNKVQGQDVYVSIEEMLKDRFPSDKPIDLYLEIEQGADRPLGDDTGDESKNPAATIGQILLNVHEQAVLYLKDTSRDKEVFIGRLLNEVDIAAATKRPVNAPPAAVPAPPAPPDFDPPPVNGHEDDGTAKKSKK